MGFDDELAREAAQAALDYVEERGREVTKAVVAIQTSEGGAIVGMRELGEDEDALLAHLLGVATVLAGSMGKTLRVTWV